MILKLVLPLFVVFASGISRAIRITHKIEHNDGVTKVLGYKENSNQVLCALYRSHGYDTNGWDTIELQTNPEDNTDEEQAFCAGQLEGLSTPNETWYHYHNTLKGLCKGRRQICKKLKTFLEEHYAWVNQSIVEHADTDSHWHHVSIFYSHVNGLNDGYGLAQSNPKRALTLTDFILLNLGGDLEELLQALEGSTVSKVRGNSHCSAIVKLLPDNRDLLVGHNTWDGYTAMRRMIKKYIMPLRTTGKSTTTVPGTSISFSGYPGVITSGDDFYVTSSGLVAMETTIGNSNASLWQDVKPTGQIFENVRSLAALRLAKNGESWCKIFSKYNSGTYNNQWMIVNLNKFKSGSEPEKGTLYVLEQIPSYVRWEDQTKVLKQQTYWPSYNVPFYPDVFKLSGNQELVDQYGDWFSYNNTARAQIFRRDHSSVTDLDSLMKLLRYNDYKHDPYAACNCTPPYSAENAIAARSDLNPKKGKYPFDALGHRAHGAIDAKVISPQLAQNLTFVAVCGPTQGTKLPQFDWRKSDFKHLPHLGQPKTFSQFKPFQPTWQGPFF